MDNHTHPNQQPTPAETIEQQIRSKEDAAFMQELQALQKKYKRVLLPVINQSRLGIIPSLTVVKEEEYLSIMGNINAGMPQPEGGKN